MNPDNIDDSVQQHLKLYHFNNSLNSIAPNFQSKTIGQAELDPSASIHIRIVDFGFGK